MVPLRSYLALPPCAPVPAVLSCGEPRHLLLLARTPSFLLGLDCSWALTGLRGHFFEKDFEAPVTGLAAPPAQGAPEPSETSTGS